MFKFKFSLLALLLISSVLFAQNPLLNEHSVKFENSTTASLVGENGLIMRTTDNGLSWTEQNTNISNTLFGFSIFNGISIAAGENGVILRSADNGTTWDPIIPGTIENLNDAEIISNTSVVVCGNNGVLYYSGDQGLNWQEVDSKTTNDLRDIKFANNNVGFIIGANSTLLKTNNGGQSWDRITIPMGNIDLTGIGLRNENEFTVIGNEGAIFLTDNCGESWHGPMLTPQYNLNFNDIVLFNTNDGIIACDDGLILKTTDGGECWFPSQTNLSGDLYDFHSVAFYDANSGITVGANGVEVYTTDGGLSWTDNPPTNISVGSDPGNATSKVILKQNFPNPFNPSTNISYELPFSANVTLKVYDIAGKEVSALVSGYQNPGSYSVHFDASSLASGVYLYKLIVSNGLNSFSKVNKMILTK